MKDPRSIDVGQVWWFWFSTNAFAVDKRLRRFVRLLPRDPRCKFCNAPFRGVGGTLMRVMFGKEQSALNPRFCNLCDIASRQFPGGAEVDMSILFVDIRGSTPLSEQMSATKFSGIISRFYKIVTKAVIDSDGLVEKLAGDAVAAFWGAGFAGPEYVKRTIETAQAISDRLAGEGIPAGIGVHAGIAYFGAISTEDGLTNFAAAGDEVNLTARIASQAAAGEVIVSDQALQKAGIETGGLEARTLELKGIRAPVSVKVFHQSSIANRQS